MTDRPKVYGLLAEFDTPAELLRAARAVRDAGYRRIDAFTPFPVEGLADALGFKRNRLPLIILIGGLVGGIGGFFMQYYANVFAYPMNIGGRPDNSWPAFIPITFELTVLSAAFAAVLGMLGLNGLPTPHHPLFAVPRFSRATQNGFFLCVKSRDAQFDVDKTRQVLKAQKPRDVVMVPL